MKFPNSHPKPPLGIDETGLPWGLLFELILKRAFLDGSTSLGHLAEETKLEFDVVNAVFRKMQKEQLCEVKGLIGRDYELTLSTQGLRMAEEAYRRNQYCGPAPVPLMNYCHRVQEQALRPSVNRESLLKVLSDLVVNDYLIQSLGTAIMTGGAIFLYGPTGNGKTSIAERLPRIFEDLIYLPFAVEVSGQVLKVFDPVVHQPASEQPADVDRRWVLCRRPFLNIGGELQGAMLEPRIDDVTRICLAPLPMLANNGILFIDDFGRQRIDPRELLNRWIVPLDRKTDSFSLSSGIRFTIPFEIMVVFATNLELKRLAEDAFMRRIKNKVKIDTVAPDMFVLILRQECKRRNIQCAREIEEYLCGRCAEASPEGLRACFPRDVIDIASGAAAFQQRLPSLERSDIEHALKLYFIQ